MKAPWKRDAKKATESGDRPRRLPRVPVWVVDGFARLAIMFVWAVLAFLVTAVTALVAVSLGMFAASRLGVTADSSMAELILVWAPFTAVWVIAASRVAAKANASMWKTLQGLRDRVVEEASYGS